MEGNKENESTQQPQQNLNKFDINYYNKMSADEFEGFCKRLVTLHQTGVYIPPPEKPRICNKKKRNKKTCRKYIPKETKEPTPTRFGKGRVGVSCESYGVKNCACCAPDNTAQRHIPILKNALENHQNRSEIYEQIIESVARGSNKNKSNKNDTAVFKVNADTENKPDSFHKYDKKIEDFIVKTQNYEKRLQNILAKYETTENIKLENNPVDDALHEHDYFNNNNTAIIIDDESFSVPSTSFSKINHKEPKLIDAIILSDSDNEVSNTFNISQDCTILSDSDPVDKINQSSVSTLSPNKRILNRNKNRKRVKSVINSNIVTIDDNFSKTSNEESNNKLSSQEKGIVMNCPVCLETLANKEIMSTICGHIFCMPCIKNCIKRTKNCPNCRKKLTLKSIHPIFF